MKRIEVQLSDEIADRVKGANGEELDKLLEQAEKLQKLEAGQAKTGQRKTVLFYLLLAGGVILGVSLFLILGQSVGWTNLPEAVIEILVGSVVVEFVGMLWAVVRYFFPRGG